MELLEAWAASAGAEALVPEVAEVIGSAKTTADGRADGVAWLATGVVEPGRAASDLLPDLLECLAVGSGDKAAEVGGCRLQFMFWAHSKSLGCGDAVGCRVHEIMLYLRVRCSAVESLAVLATQLSATLVQPP